MEYNLEKNARTPPRQQVMMLRIRVTIPLSQQISSDPCVGNQFGPHILLPRPFFDTSPTRAMADFGTPIENPSFNSLIFL